MFTILTWLAVLLGIIAIARLVRIYELVSELRGGKPQWEVTEEDNRAQSRMWFLFAVAFFGFCAWNLYEFADKILPTPASEHGETIDWLLYFNFAIIGFVFVVANAFLFYFGFRYYQSKKNNVAYFYPVNHKLELVWTVVPGIILAIIIFLGIKTWTEITSAPPKEENSLVIELYAKQFDWTVRYAGRDNELGKRNFKLITDLNPMGLDYTDPKVKDDIVARNVFYLPKGTRVHFRLGARDVIHSAYMPHFRAQMNCVPGMTTHFHFVPTITTKEMRKNPRVIKNVKEINKILIEKGHIEEQYEFNYLLLCNKICGTSHYNMQMDIVVVEPEEFEEWLSKQKTVGESVAFLNEKPETESLLAGKNNIY